MTRISGIRPTAEHGFPDTSSTQSSIFNEDVTQGDWHGRVALERLTHDLRLASSPVNFVVYQLVCTVQLAEGLLIFFNVKLVNKRLINS